MVTPADKKPTEPDFDNLTSEFDDAIEDALIPIARTKIPFIPRQIDSIDLDEKGNLLTNEQIKVAIETYEKAENSYREKRSQATQLQKQSLENMNKRIDSDESYKNYQKALKILSELAPPPFRFKLPGHKFTIVMLYDETQKKNRYFALYKGQKHGKHLGAGAFGKVKWMQELVPDQKEPGGWYPVKLQKIQQNAFRNIAKAEFDKLKQVGQAVGAEFRIENTDREYKEQHIMGMELAPGVELAKFANSGVKKPTITWVQIACNALEAIQALHKQRLLHIDIKPENFMYDISTNKITVIDLGFALPAPETRQLPRGTPGFMAPELNQPGKPVTYNEKTEVYALGRSIADIFDLIDPKTGSIRDPSDPELDKNQKITNLKLRTAIIEHLKLMTDKDPKNRPPLADAIAFFRDIEINLLNVAGNIKKVGVLDIAEYHSSNRAQRKALTNALKLVDEVCLVDLHQKHPAEYSTIRNELEAMGIGVRGEVLHSEAGAHATPAQLIADLATAESQPNSAKNIFSYTLITQNANQKDKPMHNTIGVIGVTANKHQANYPKELEIQLNKNYLSDAQFKLLEDFFEKEIKRLEDKKSYFSADVIEKRTDAIQKVLIDFRALYAGKKLDQTLLEIKLHVLQNKMISTNLVSKKLTEWFKKMPQTESAKKFKEIRKAITTGEQEKLGERLKHVVEENAPTPKPFKTRH